MKKEFFSTIEAAKIVGMSRIAIFKKIKNGSLPATQVGKNYIIKKADLLELLKSHTKKLMRREERKKEKEQ